MVFAPVPYVAIDMHSSGSYHLKLAEFQFTVLADITDCKLKLILGLIWTLILHYSISMPMYDG
jgi:hypothetical protein